MLLFDEYIDYVHRMPWWERIERTDIRKLLVLFAKRVDRGIKPWARWDNIEGIDLEQVTTLGFVKKDDNTGELTVTELGKDVRKAMGWLYAIYDTTV